MGAALRVPFARLAAGEDALALLEAAEFETLALSPAGVEAVSDIVRPPRAAVLLGAEGPGLPPALLTRTRTLRIPMADGWDSLNVAAASAIVLHQLQSPSPARENERLKPASLGQPLGPLGKRRGSSGPRARR